MTAVNPITGTLLYSVVCGVVGTLEGIIVGNKVGTLLKTIITMLSILAVLIIPREIIENSIQRPIDDTSADTLQHNVLSMKRDYLL